MPLRARISAACAVLLALPASAGAGELDVALAGLAGAPLSPAFCAAMDDNRAGLYRDGSVDPKTTGMFVLSSAGVARMTAAERARAGLTAKAPRKHWVVNGPILPTETRRFVLVADPKAPRARCALYDLGGRT